MMRHPHHLIVMQKPQAPDRQTNKAASAILDSLIRQRKVAELQSFIRDGSFVEPVYINAQSYNLAASFVPEVVPMLDEHMLRHYY